MSKKPPRCYVDSNVIIDYVASSSGATLNNNKIEEMNCVQKILNSAKDGSIYLFSSDITKLECLHAGDSSKLTDEIKRKFRSILDSGEVIRPISVNSIIIENARDMHWDGFPLPGNIDKIHIASAIFSKCQELITFDGFRRDHFKKNHQEDNACIEELCKNFNISVIYPSESWVLQREYYYDMKEKVKKDKKAEEERRKNNRLNLLDMIQNEN